MTNPYLSNPDVGEPSGRIPDWRELVAILMERAWVGITVLLIVVSLSFLYLRRTPPLYRSTAVLLVQPQAPQILNYQNVASVNMRNLEYFNTIINTLHSRQMMERAISESRLRDSPDFYPGVTGVVQKAAAARGSITIDPVEKSRLVKVSAVSPHPAVAAELANAMARAYIQQDLDNRMESSVQAVEWLREKSNEYQAKLEKGLADLQEYREKAGSVSLEEDQNIVIAKLKSLNEALTESQTRRIEAEAVWSSIQSQIDQDAPREQVAAQLPDTGVNNALVIWRAQERKVAEMKQRYKADYPELAEELQTEQILKKRFEESCDLAVHALKSRYETLRAAEEGIQKALQEQEQKAFALSRELVRYNEMKRNAEADEEIYRAVIDRMREANAVETLPSDAIRIAEEARPESRPFSPNAKRVMFRGTLLGLVLGFGTVFLFYYSDHRFRRNEEVERALGVPVLGAVPYVVGKNVHDRGTVCNTQSTGEVLESFRTLRAVMQVTPSIKNAKVFLVTSTQPSEGKSLVATNLAIIFSQNGQKTLLVGADMRRPAYKPIFAANEMPAGLAEVLKGKLSWRDVIQTKLVPGLDVLPAGAVPSHPSELIGSPRMASIMAEIREDYDCVFLDSSPMMGISDSLLLMKHVDGALFVVRQGVTHSHGATHAMQRLSASETPCLGAIMNGVNFRSLTNYYYYKRYGGYDYRQYQEPTEEIS